MSGRLTPEREAEIAARSKVASPAPWFTHEDWPGRVFSESEFNHHIARVTGTNPEPNERFIAHAREDVAALLAELAAVRAERDEARAKVRELEALTARATQFRIEAPDSGAALLIRRSTRGKWAVIESEARGRRKTLTPTGWRIAAVLADSDIFVWPDAATAVAQARTALTAGTEADR